ncbi:non-specific lipid transfer protein GPI-anchored 5-like [Lolium perenne]|uniref:non-specific lipid transfer protein GPI-anchored 5-like n=1 Tax=Lolium perenne TaxID=4522 RepID=UPI0021EA03B3|nr:non-specific lipid transfer protein GPI-anchored 5-like [Lolium perenne]
MAIIGAKSFFMVAVAAVLVMSASAQSGCTVALIGLYPCMNYISGNETAPTKSCCSQLSSVVQSQPECLCSALSGDSVGGMTINKTRALELPKACNVQTPPVSKCNDAGGASAPVADAPTTPELQTPAAADSGSKATPSGHLQQNGVSSLHGPVGLVFALAAAAFYAVSTV